MNSHNDELAWLAEIEDADNETAERMAAEMARDEEAAQRWAEEMGLEDALAENGGWVMERFEVVR